MGAEVGGVGGGHGAVREDQPDAVVRHRDIYGNEVGHFGCGACGDDGEDGEFGGKLDSNREFRVGFVFSGLGMCWLSKASRKSR